MGIHRGVVDADFVVEVRTGAAAADRGRLAEHVGLQRAGCIPGRLPAHGGVEREDQAPARARRGEAGPSDFTFWRKASISAADVGAGVWCRFLVMRGQSTPD